MSDQQNNTPAPLASSDEKGDVSPPSVTTKKTDKLSSKENSENITKKKRPKRTSEEILEEIRSEKKPEAPVQPTSPLAQKSSPPPPRKKVKVVASDDDEESEAETPSFFKGVVAKPLLLAGLGGLTFFVNHWFKTTTKTTPKPQYQHAKQKHLQPAAAVFPKTNTTTAAPSYVSNTPTKLPTIQGFSS